MGDGVLVYFGYPQAHEDDAERAVRAGLELIAAVTALKAGGTAANPRRHCDRAGRRRRPDRIGGSAGARHRRRDAKPCGAPAGHRRAEHAWSSPKARENFSAICSSLQDLGAKDLKGIAGPVRAWAALRASSVEGRFEALHASRLDRARRARRRTRIAAAALGESKERRRPSGAPFRRGRHRQIAAHGGAAGTPRRRAAHALALFLLAAAHRQRVLSDHRPDGTRRRTGARRHAAERSSTSSMPCWRRPRPPNRTPRSLPRCCRSPNDGRYPALELTPQQRRQKNAGSAHFADRGADTPKSGADDLRGCALDRPHEPRTVRSGCGSDRDPSRAADRDVPAGIRGALDRTAACDRAHHQSAGATRRRRHDRPRRRQQARCRRASGRTSSSAPTAFRCSSRR